MNENDGTFIFDFWRIQNQHSTWMLLGRRSLGSFISGVGGLGTARILLFLYFIHTHAHGFV